MFKRKVYQQLLEWKGKYAGQYACLLEGARRVGKTTIAEAFAQNEYKSYILIDFANAAEEILDIFHDVARPDLFFLRLQAETGITLYKGNSVIIFDEIQLYPKARQAIKYLVKDGRYHYIETGSLISIRKNVKDILIPSEEMRIRVYPMDYEEFLWATGGNPALLESISEKASSLGNSINRSLMRDFRIYMAVGGMPQSVAAYIESNNFETVDRIKREIIDLYMADLKKTDLSGRLSDMYRSVPAQLALKKNRFVISAATGKQKTNKDMERLSELIDSQVVLPCYHVTQPNLSLAQTRDPDRFKLYLSDTGLFTTLLFNDGTETGADIYKKLLSDKLDANFGYLYENAAAQILTANGRKLFYHTWEKPHTTHQYEVDFLIISNSKVVPIEIKSADPKFHHSIDQFAEKYSHYVGDRYVFSQKDAFDDGMLKFRPMYMLPFLTKTASDKSEI